MTRSKLRLDGALSAGIITAWLANPNPHVSKDDILAILRFVEDLERDLPSDVDLMAEKVSHELAEYVIL